MHTHMCDRWRFVVATNCGSRSSYSAALVAGYLSSGSQSHSLVYGCFCCLHYRPLSHIYMQYMCSQSHCQNNCGECVCVRACVNLAKRSVFRVFGLNNQVAHNVSQTHIRLLHMCHNSISTCVDEYLMAFFSFLLYRF